MLDSSSFYRDMLGVIRETGIELIHIDRSILQFFFFTAPLCILSGPRRHINSSDHDKDVCYSALGLRGDIKDARYFLQYFVRKP